MSTFTPHDFGPAFEPLLITDRRRPLDAGRSDSAALPALKQLSTKSAFAHTGVANADMAACCISGIWLLHDYLDESHTISQDIETPSGSFWHGIMHRREGDFWNSKYWFRRVGQHPAFDALGERATETLSARVEHTKFEKQLLPSGKWDPFAFVDLCEKSMANSSPAHELCLDLQQAEWESLFDYCYRQAIGQ